MLKRLLIIISISFFASCVPNKDLVYLQGKPIAKKDVYKLNDQPYRLQAGDVLSIDIKAKDEKSVALFKKTVSQNQNNSGGNVVANLQTGYSINRHGNIRLPYLGEINVLGYTTKEVRIKLEKSLLQFLKNEEDIFVTVNLSGIKFTILGEIASPGTKVINQNSVNIFEAISNSGDITVTGNRKKVEVWRNSVSGQKKFTIDLTNTTAFNSEIYYIQPNDMIYIVPLKQKAWGTGTTGLQSLTTIVSVLTLLTSTILIFRNL
jgi:polysaccharide export outer membrane protein